MTSPGPTFQECTGSCHVNVPAPKAVSSQSGIDRWSDCIGQDRDSRHLGTLSTILQHFTHNETQYPLLLADVALCCGMYPACKVDISLHLAIPGFPQSDLTVSKPSADAGSLCSEDPLTSSHPQMPASQQTQANHFSY
jgi:hypothetical protein